MSENHTDLLPANSSPDWWVWHGATTLFLIALGAPLWYFAYIEGHETMQAAELFTGFFMSIGMWTVVPVFFWLVIAIVGPPLSCIMGYRAAKRSGSDMPLTIPLMAIVSVTAWPFQMLAVYLHWRNTPREKPFE